jgi:hypothetical protein
MTHYLKRAWQRGETVEYRERGAEGDFWFLDPPEWDPERYEYREYRPLPRPELTLSAAQQAAIELGKTLVEKRRAVDQAAASMQQFSAAYKPLPWWRRGLRSRAVAWVLFVGFSLALTAASWLLGQWVAK